MRLCRSLTLALIACVIILLPNLTNAGGLISDPMKGPCESLPENDYKEPSVNPMLQAIVFYRDIISPVDGDRCPMYPTCSQYSIECLKKHGLIMGTIMTCDRLIHEANEIDLAPLVEIHGFYRCYDPIKWNDFWWYDKN